MVVNSHQKHAQDVAKRIFDLAVSVLALTVLWPVFAAIAIAVKLDSPGPVFYRGVRTGRYGVPFRIFKFRTMVQNAESIGGGSTAKDDPRITRVGRFLRKYKLDELPQLLNVIKGEMSLVGPRPELPQYTSQYTLQEQAILSVRPGITDFSSIEYSDLAEVLGSEDADRVYEEKVLPVKNQMRLKYVAERSFWLDLRLIVLTIFKILTKIWGR
ncbi:MAG: sugar transferase [Armatimonadota bacterium]